MVLSYGQRGTLTSQLKDGRWEAQVGLIKMTLEEKEFDLVQAQQEKQVKKKQVNVVKRTSGRGPQARLDLRGKRYEEAMNELDAFIDQALLNNMAQVDIIHGIGTGVIPVKELPNTYKETSMSRVSAMPHKMLEAVAQLL